MNLSRRSRSLVVVLLGVALAGCSPAPVAAPTPSPTYGCVPEAGGDPVPCGPIEFEQAQQRDALYSEAEAVYRRYWAEWIRLEQLPDPTLTPELEAVTAGDFQQRVVRLLAGAQGRPRLSGDPELAWIRRLPGLSRAGSVVALSSCTDASHVRFVNPDGEPTPGLTNEHRLYLSRDEGGSLRITDSEFRAVASC
jgi:hypothetical protein